MITEDKEEMYYERCAGIDVHKKQLTVCLRIGQMVEVREYGSLTQEIREMVGWLKGNGVQMVAMESTGSYWKPLYNIMEEEGLPAMVCNAYHLKNVPGRKTDKNDAKWIAKCLSRGLLNASFVPDREQRELRDMTRFRKSQIEERARNLNRLQKFLEGANIKLGDYVTEIEGKSATALLELVIGKPDFTVDDVASRKVGKLNATPEELFASLENSITPTQREFFGHVMRVIREQTAQIDSTDEMIKNSLSENYRAAVEMLDEIPGIGEVAAEQIIAEVGDDMSRFKNQNGLCMWAGVCPGNNESAGKRKTGKTPHGNQALKTTLTQCAKSAVKKKDSFFAAQYSRLVSHRGKNRATMAVAHSILIAIYFVLSGFEFRDLGADYYTQFNRDRKINSHVKQLSKLGLAVPDDLIQDALSHPPG
jgi:transposase